MSRHDTVGNHKTVIGQEYGKSFVQYHSTKVVQWDIDEIELYTGGWFTNTTKLRMNQTSQQFNLGYSVWQKKGEWFVVYKGHTFKFSGNVLLLDRNMPEKKNDLSELTPPAKLAATL